tara:strand:+ start:114 stop:224 length:111 start_codon:yes stop_codon:yes gene_type:complete
VGFDEETIIYKDFGDYSSAVDREKLGNVFQEANLNG